jgi:hypothetical protein
MVELFEIHPLIWLVNIAQLSEPIVDKIGFPVFQGYNRQSSWALVCALSAFCANMVLVHLDIFSDAKTNHAKSGIFASCPYFSGVGVWMHHVSPPDPCFLK